MSRTIGVVLGLVVLVLLFLGLFSPPEQRFPDPYIGSSIWNLRGIWIALNNYEAMNGKLPPAVVRGKEGQPLYSWRVLLLPYLEYDDIYKQFKLDEAWDSLHNKALLAKTPGCYRPMLTNDAPPGMTRYKVFVGPGTAFGRDGLNLYLAEDFPDGLSNTFLVVEGGEPVFWSKPEDLVYDPGKPLPALDGPYSSKAGFNSVFGDGEIHFIRGNTDEVILRAFITRNGGEKVTLPKEE